MIEKKTNRLRRAKRARMKIRELAVPRLCVHRSPRHTYAQIVAPDAAHTVVAASTLEAPLREGLKSTCNIAAAKRIGAEIAKRAAEKGIKKVAFDRSGFKYHGRIKALADAAREGGLEF